MLASLVLNICDAEKSVKKCCNRGELLNLETKQCFSKQIETRMKFFPEILLNLHVNPGSRRQVENRVYTDETNLPAGIPICTDSKDNDDLQILGLDDGREEYFLSTDGNLVSLNGQYELSRDLGDFCIDLAVENLYSDNVSRVALACDPCGSGSNGLTCIKTCCPHTSGLAVSDDESSTVSLKCMSTRSEVYVY